MGKQLSILSNIHHTAYQNSINIELWVSSIQVQVSSPTEARIAENTPYDTCYHQVSLQTKSRTCYEFKQNGIPYTHPFALILGLNYQFPLVFLPQFCSVQTWHGTYSTSFCPVVFGPHLPGDLIQTQKKNSHAMLLALTTIAAQLTMSLPALRPLISKAIEEHSNILRQRLSEQWKHLILDPLKKAPVQSI